MATAPSADAIRSFTSDTLAVQGMSSQEAVCDPGMELLCWGSGDLGQTGQGGGRDICPQEGVLEAFTPGKLGRVKLLACGSCHSIVVTVDNRIFTWGNGSSGQLGDGERNMKDRPSEVFLPLGGSEPEGEQAVEVAGVACGGRHTFVWTPSGDAFSFGNNFYAQLGYDFRKMDFKGNQLVPHLFRSLPWQRVAQVACGERHTLFALEDGSVAACGANDYGQIGTRSCDDAAVPRFVEDLYDITSIACGANHNLALSGKGKVFQWGCGRACGNLRRNLAVPEEVSLPPVSVKSVRGGCWHSLLLTDDGKVYSWGMGQEGQLGQGQNMAFLSSPCLLQSGLLSPGVLQIEAGESYSAALTADGGLFLWGRNCGVMDAGRPSSQRVWSPERVALGGREVCAVGCGAWHTLALTGPRAGGPGPQRDDSSQRRWGNWESRFTETGALFKEDSSYPQPTELQPRENGKQTPPASTEPGDPMNHNKVTPKRSSGNAPFEDTDKTQRSGNIPIEDTDKTWQSGNAALEDMDETQRSRNIPIEDTDKTRWSGDTPFEDPDKTRQSGNAALEDVDKTHWSGNAPFEGTDKTRQSGNALFEDTDKPRWFRNTPAEDTDKPQWSRNAPFEDRNKTWNSGNALFEDMDKTRLSGNSQFEDTGTTQRSRKAQFEDMDKTRRSGKSLFEDTNKIQRSRNTPFEATEKTQNSGIAPFENMDKSCHSRNAPFDNTDKTQHSGNAPFENMDKTWLSGNSQFEDTDKTQHSEKAQFEDMDKTRQSGKSLFKDTNKTQRSRNTPFEAREKTRNSGTAPFGNMDKTRHSGNAPFDNTDKTQHSGNARIEDTGTTQRSRKAPIEDTDKTRHSRNSPFEDTDKTDFLRAGRSDVTATGKGNGRSSITQRAYGDGEAAVPTGADLIPPASADGPSLPLAPDAVRPGDQPRLQDRKPPQRVSSRNQVGSRKACDHGSDSSAITRSRTPQQRSVPGAPTAREHSPAPSQRDQQPGPWRAKHLSPLTPHPRPRRRPTSSPSLRRSQTPLVGPARPVHKQVTFSSGTAWKDVSMAADPILSHKRLAAANSQKR